MKATLALLLVLLTAFGLAGQKPKFDKATVFFYTAKDGTPLKASKQLVVPYKDLSKLTRFFPGFAEKRKGSKPAGWNARVEIRLLRQNEPPLVLRVNGQADTWTWGSQNGDFKAEAGLDEYLTQLEAKATPKGKTE